MPHELNAIQMFAVAVLPVLFAITVHEVAHGWVAKQFGDPTAQMLGRLTLNPIRHIDPIGTVLVPIALAVSTGFIFGWAKPVPVTVQNLRNPKRDMAFVALAGPGANLIMALFWGGVIKLALIMGPDFRWFAYPMVMMGQYGVSINLLLMLLNLLPIPPLDGGRVMTSILPGPLSYQFSRLETFGMVAVVLLMVTGIFGKIIGPPMDYLGKAIFSIFGIV